MRTWNNDWETFIEVEAKREREAKQRELYERCGGWHGDSQGAAGETEAGAGVRGQRSGEVDIRGILAQANLSESGGWSQRPGGGLDAEVDDA